MKLALKSVEKKASGTSRALLTLVKTATISFGLCSMRWFLPTNPAGRNRLLFRRESLVSVGQQTCQVRGLCAAQSKSMPGI